MKDNEQAKGLLQQIVDMEQELNECIVHTLQRDGDIIPAFKKYNEEAADKIKKEFDAKMKETEKRIKNIRDHEKMQDAMLEDEDENLAKIANQVKEVVHAPKRSINLLQSLTQGEFVVNRDDKNDLALQNQSTSTSSGGQNDLSPQKQNSLIEHESIKPEQAPDYLEWTEQHSSKLEELMAKFEHNIETVHHKYNRFLNRNVKVKLQKNFLYNIDKLTLLLIYRDIELRNELLPDDKKEEHRNRIKVWMEEERQRILAEKEKEKQRVVAEAKKLMAAFKKKFKKHLQQKIKEAKDKEIERQKEEMRLNHEMMKRANRVVPDRDEFENDFKKINRDYRKTKK